VSAGPSQAGEQPSMVWKGLGTLLWVIRRVNEAVVVILFSALCTVLFAQVIARFAFHAPFSWSEEMVRYFQVWLVLLGSAVTMRRGQHIVIDFLTHQMPAPVERFFAVLMNAIIVVYLMVVLRFTPDLIEVTSFQTSPAMQMPMNWVYMAVPVGATLLLIEAVISLVRRLKGLDPFEQVVREAAS
jgi:TRAP-type C4-dicarboxylate transport system permease small subunit